MKIVIGQSEMANEARDTSYQAPFPLTKKCRECKEDAILFMLVNDDKGDIIKQRPKDVQVWPHDLSTTAVYLCTNCGLMRATWNQG